MWKTKRCFTALCMESHLGHNNSLYEKPTCVQQLVQYQETPQRITLQKGFEDFCITIRILYFGCLLFKRSDVPMLKLVRSIGIILTSIISLLCYVIINFSSCAMLIYVALCIIIVDVLQYVPGRVQQSRRLVQEMLSFVNIEDNNIKQQYKCYQYYYH